MEFFPKPLHIDFVITYQDKTKTTGYWFMTFIIGPKDCKVWYKARNGNWYLTGSVCFDEDNFSHSYQGDGIFPNSKAQANHNEQTAMDKFLGEHLRAGGYLCKPYVYWQNAQNVMTV
jgi:hypothetical protein